MQHHPNFSAVEESSPDDLTALDAPAAHSFDPNAAVGATESEVPNWTLDPLAVELLAMLKRWPAIETTKTGPSNSSLMGRERYTYYSGPIVAALNDLHEHHYREVEKNWQADPENTQRRASAFLAQSNVQDAVAAVLESEVA